MRYKKHYQYARRDAESEADPDLIKTLLQRLIQEAPSAQHRAALEVCGLARVITEPLLAELLAIPDAYDLFEWLRSLSFIQFGPRGLFPHDLTRNVLDADFRWRNPDRYLELVERARSYYLGRLPQVSSQEQQALVIDYIFLYRNSPVIQPFVEVSTQVSELPDLARPIDWPRLIQMVARHEGEEAAAQPQERFCVGNRRGRCLDRTHLMQASRPLAIRFDRPYRPSRPCRSSLPVNGQADHASPFSAGPRSL